MHNHPRISIDGGDWFDFGTSLLYPENIVRSYYENYEWVYDCDGGRTFTSTVGLHLDGHYFWFSVEHEFYWEDGYGSYVTNEFRITQLDDRPEKTRLDRNWWNHHSRRHPEPKVWPPETLEGFNLGWLWFERMK